MGAGAIVGGITGIATGSLSKGLMAGLGAYGGFGIGEALTTAGASSLGGAGAEAALKAPSVDAFVGNTEGMTQGDAFNNFLKSEANPAVAGRGDLLSAGAKSAVADPMAFIKDNKMALGMAAAPIVADMMVPTTTKAATPMAPGRIREKRWNGQYFEDVASTDAGVYNESGRNFSDLYRGYNGGGIVALAEGGDVIRMAGGTPPAMLSDDALFKQTGSWEAAASARDQQKRAMDIYNDAQKLSAATAAPPAAGGWDYSKFDPKNYVSTAKVNTQAEVDAANAANPFSAQNMAKVDTSRVGQYVTDPITGKPVALSAYSAGFDINNPTALTYLGELASRGGTDSTSQAFNAIATPAQNQQKQQ
jgi:hypothetical protein